MQRFGPLAVLVALLLAGSVPAHAGTASNPEILDSATDSDLLSGERIPHLEITKGWIEPKGDRFSFNIELAALDEVPRDAVYVFHYTFKSVRLYFRANYTDDGEFRYLAGLYEGVKDPSKAYDQQGNRNYLYLPGGPNQTERLRGSIDAGAPARISWSYPMDSFTEDRQHLAFKGLFATTYQKAADGHLQVIDTAITETDYQHQIYSPWWSKFVPGPSPALIVGALAGLALMVQGVRRRTE